MEENYKKIKDAKESEEIAKALNYRQKIIEYTNKLNNNTCNIEEVNNFVQEIINEYRNNLTVNDYYKNVTGKDNLSINPFDNLKSVDNMLNDYLMRSFGKSLLENANKYYDSKKN